MGLSEAVKTGFAPRNHSTQGTTSSVLPVPEVPNQELRSVGSQKLVLLRGEPQEVTGKPALVSRGGCEEQEREVVP